MRTAALIVLLAFGAPAVATEDEVEPVPAEQLPADVIRDALRWDPRYPPGEVVGARKVRRGSCVLLIVEAVQNGDLYESYFAPDGACLGGHLVKSRSQTTGEVFEGLLSLLLVCVIPGTLGGALVRWLVRRFFAAPRDHLIVREWFGCWFGACVVLFFAVWILGTIQEWGSVLPWSNFLIVLAVFGAIVASITEAVLLAIDALSHDRKVPRFVFVVFGIIGASSFVLLVLRGHAKDRAALERHRAIALSQCCPERMAARTKH